MNKRDLFRDENYEHIISLSHNILKGINRVASRRIALSPQHDFVPLKLKNSDRKVVLFKNYSFSLRYFVGAIISIITALCFGTALYYQDIGGIFYFLAIVGFITLASILYVTFSSKKIDIRWR